MGKYVIILNGLTPSFARMEENFVLYYNQELWKKTKKLKYLQREHEELEVKHTRLKQKYGVVQIENAILQVEK